MQEETKKEEDAVESKSDTATDETKTDSSTEEKADSEKKDEVNYKEELERVSKQLEKAERALYKKNKEERESRKSEEYEETPSVADLVRKEAEKIRLEMHDTVIEDELSRLTANDDERKLIKHYFENKIVRSGMTRENVKDDLELARLMVNRKKYERREKEKRDADISDETRSKGQTSSQDNREAESSVKLSPLEKRILERQGLSAKDIRN